MDRIFSDHMSELYWLAFLLTGDRDRSVQAFTGALNSDANPPAFQKFMLSWARRLVIVAALGTIRRELRESVSRARPATRGELKGLAHLDPADRALLTKRELEEVLLAMDVFPRCAVILTVLEGLPAREAAGLLGADEDTVKAAQVQGVTEMTWRMAGAARPVLQPPFRLGQAVMSLAATS
jgi:DNA-directed RNA polymerase specialized sigma24 family protein